MFPVPSSSILTHRYVTDHELVKKAHQLNEPCQPVDEIRTGTYRDLFRPQQLISGNEDAANNCTNRSLCESW